MKAWNKKRTVKDRYDLTASLYDTRYAAEQTAKIEAALRNISVRYYSRVLDAGCGTGLLFSYVAEKSQTTVGLDISRETLYRAKERAKHFKNAHLVLADVDNMPFAENVFTHVFAITVIQNVPDQAKTLAEINRVANRQGTVVVTGLKKTFSKKTFETLLRSAGLKIVAFEGEENLKCHVAVCAKISH